MKKTTWACMICFLLFGVTLFAADGDLIVNGNVGIGTQSPSQQLHVKTTASFLPRIYLEGPAGTGLPGINFGFGTPGRVSIIRSGSIGAQGTDLEFFTKPDSGMGTTSRMYITHDGNVGIGTTTP